MKDFLQAEVARLEAELNAAKAKLDAFVAEVPAEFHSLTHEVWAKLKAFFE